MIPKRLTFLGSDVRFGETVREFARRGYTVAAVNELPNCHPDVYILPLPATRDGVTVTGTHIPLSSLPADVPLIGGALPLCLQRENAVDILKNETFALQNARLTAEGVIKVLYENRRVALCDRSFAILGYGRIATYLCHRLLAFGARVSVYARRKDARDDAVFTGAAAFSFETPVREKEIVNTVPPPVTLPPCPRDSFFTT